MRKKSVIFIPLVLALTFSGCEVFTSHYDATRHENFTKLKAIHVKFFEDWTEGSGKEWNEDEVSSYCDEGDLNFREAFEYAKSKDKPDKTGQRAVEILWEQFNEDCKLCLEKKKLFRRTFTDEMLSEIVKNYDYAIAGEEARVHELE